MEVAGVHVEQGSNIPVVLLREIEAPHRVLPIHIGGPEAAAIAMAMTGHVPPRPLAHDVMAQLVDRLDARVDAAELIDVRNGTFIAHLSLVGPHGLEHVDSRASDAIALAMRVGAPVMVAEAVLVELGATPEQLEGFESLLDDEPLGDGRRSAGSTDHVIDDELIEEELEDFRLFLSLVEPDDFAI
ncbi:MAG: bifunctional nuclease family protein [Acidimicrobiales bacterium]